MTVRRTVAGVRSGDVSIVLPTAVLIVGAIVAITGRGYIGLGVAVGGILAYVNSLLLVKRIELAAGSGNSAAAMVSMQLGLLVTFTLVAAITVVMAVVSLPMTIAMGISFFISQTLELILYYRARKHRLSSAPMPTLTEKGI